MSISEVIEGKRHARGIPYAELGRRCGINRDMVGRFCKGTSMPSAEQLVRLCAELELELSDFTDKSAPLSK